MSIPSEDAIKDYISESPEPVTFREMARAFDIKGDERRELRRLLKALSDRGTIEKLASKAYGLPSRLPDTAVVEVIGQGVDGEILARPVTWEQEGEPPAIEVESEGKGHSPFQEGDRLFVRLRRFDEVHYLATVIRRLETPQNRVIGMVIKTSRGYELKPGNKKTRNNYILPKADLGAAAEGDVVVAEIQPRGRQRHAPPQVRVLKVMGRETDTNIISLISAQEFGLRDRFPPAAIEETKDMKVPELGDREDLRNVPLVTIDPVDARDFDDAVYAKRTEKGFYLLVAIADVSYYVRPGSSLDREALERGNSTYFPDRVIPMLPESISNDLCSLRPQEERACVAVHMWIDEEGELERFKFVRGLMKSRARLTYEQVQAALDGNPDKAVAPLVDEIIHPVHEAYTALKAAREERGVMDLYIPERKIIFNDEGEITGIREKERLDSHQIVEEFMILANVAAAKALADRKTTGLYRIHDKPDPAKLESLREFCQAFGVRFPKGPVTEPGPLADVLKQAGKVPFGHLIKEVMLRSQKRAHYSHENIGHFGLALPFYTHFTSPIRRYSDLLVHRMLVDIFDLGPGGMDAQQRAQVEEMALHISQTERISAEAEWSAVDRYMAAWLAGQTGNIFRGQITGLSGAGLFIRLKDSGADAFAPMRTLPQDYYIHDEVRHALIGRHSGRVYRLGAELEVVLREADPLSGNTIVELLDERGADIPGAQFKAPGSRRGGKSGKKRRPEAEGRKKRDRKRNRRKR